MVCGLGEMWFRDRESEGEIEFGWDDGRVVPDYCQCAPETYPTCWLAAEGWAKKLP